MMGWMAPLRHLSAKLLSDRISSEWEPSMGEVTTIGLDLAKHVFQVHGVDAEGATVLRKQLRRAQVLGFFRRLPRCLVGHVGLELRNVDANYPFERSHRFAGIQPNSGFGDYSRLSCGVADTQLGRRPGSRQGADRTPAGVDCRSRLWS